MRLPQFRQRLLELEVPYPHENVSRAKAFNAPPPAFFQSIPQTVVQAVFGLDCQNSITLTRSLNPPQSGGLGTSSLNLASYSLHRSSKPTPIRDHPALLGGPGGYPAFAGAASQNMRPTPPPTRARHCPPP